jgi:hypothetical protein
MMFSSSTLALLAETLRALAADIDQLATGDVGTVPAKAGNGAAVQSSLSSGELAEIRQQALAIINAAVKQDPGRATDLVKEILGQFGAARVSDLTTSNVNQALDALQKTFGSK